MSRIGPIKSKRRTREEISTPSSIASPVRGWNTRDPLANIRNSNSVSMVMVNGRLFDGNTLDEVYPRKKPLVRQPWSYTLPSAAAGIRQ